jgi:hypothetical protein
MVSASMRVNLAALGASERDRERLVVWASCGFNARAAARCRPDLGGYKTFSRTRRRYQVALVALIRGEVLEAVSG